MGSLALFEGDLASARSFYADSLEAERKLGDRWGIACCLTGFGALAAAEADRMPYIHQQQHARKAARLLAAAQVILDSLGTHFASPLADIQQRGGETACRLLGDAEFQRAHTDGRFLTIEEALDLVDNFNSFSLLRSPQWSQPYYGSKEAILVASRLTFLLTLHPIRPNFTTLLKTACCLYLRERANRRRGLRLCFATGSQWLLKISTREKTPRARTTPTRTCLPFECGRK